MNTQRSTPAPQTVGRFVFVSAVAITLAFGLRLAGAKVTPPAVTQLTTVTVVSPNGGEVWLIGTTQTIAWTLTQPVSGAISVVIYRGPAGDFDSSVRIVSYGPFPSASIFSYDWYIDPRAFGPGEDYWVYIGFLTAGIVDRSDGNFYLSVGDANVVVSNCDVAPVAPAQLQPGNPLALQVLLKNNDLGTAGPFWTEVWGSRTGGLTLDRFLTDSLRTPNGLGAGDSYSWVTSLPLYSLPDGPYTVVYVADRLNEVGVETSKHDNRAIVRGKRILVIRPETQADLAIEGFGLSPNPAQSGQPISISGRVVNRGTEPSGPFWIEFWGSWEWPYPALNFFLCDSIYVENLDAGAAINLASRPCRLYDVPAGLFTVGCIADRDDAINELNETNNFQFVDGQVFNHPWPIQRQSKAQPQAADIVVTAADFTPCAPVQSKPGDLMTCSVTLRNAGASDTGPFWVEFWGSRDGGLTLSEMLRESVVANNLRPGQTATLVSHAPLYSLPDGRYSLTVVADRLGNVEETVAGNNRLTVGNKRLLMIRPQGLANLTVEFFLPAYNMDARIINSGTADSGPFWVEFWAAPGDPIYPGLHYFAADSIYCPNVPAGGELWTRSYERLAYDWLRGTDHTIICFVDRSDHVSETDETDNYASYYLLAPQQ